MKKDDVVFDEDYCIYGVKVAQEYPVIISILDDLTAADEVLQDGYKEKIADFVNSSLIWLPIASAAIEKEMGSSKGLKLMTIYVLFEQYSDVSTYGLLFNLDADREHGRGVKINGENFDIIKYGNADVAFEV